MLTVLYILAGSILVLLAMLVLINNPKNKINTMFFYFALSGSAWLLSNLVINLSSGADVALAFTRLTTATSSILALLFVLFIEVFRGAISNHSKQLWWWLIAMGFAVASFTDLMVVSVSPHGDKIEFGGLYYPLVLFLLSFFSYGGYRLWRLYRTSTGDIRNNASYMFLGISLSAIFGITLNAILPLLGNEEAAKYGALSVFFFAVLAGISIVRHKLFDIRLVVARLLTYMLTVGTLVIAFVVTSYALSSSLLNVELGSGQQIYLIVSSIIFAITYQPIKRFFDKATNKIFFRESYNSDELLDEFSDFLANEIEIEKVIENTANFLKNSVRPTKAFVFLYSEGNSQWHEIIGNVDDHIKDKLNKTLEYQKATTIVVEDQEYEHEEPFANNLVKLLREEGLAVSVRLATGDELVGFFVLGDKKDGSLYKTKDITFLNTMANSLAVALQNAQRFDEIQKFNITLQQEVKSATRELRETNEKLKELDEAKDEFISMASHQLRTPLTSIKGYLSMIREGDVGEINDKQKDMLDSAFASSQRMVYLIADFLNVSRLKTGKFVIEPTEVDLPKAIEGQIDQLRDVAKSRGVELVFKRPDDFPKVMMDLNKTEQVIMNFMDNAVYYTKGGGEVNIELEKKDKSIEFRVVDQGMGVPKKDQKNMFTKFFRAGNARKARPDGTGLGLFMAKKVIVAQGGATVFKSKEGEGSTFGFNFPLEKIKIDN